MNHCFHFVIKIDETFSFKKLLSGNIKHYPEKSLSLLVYKYQL